MKTPNKEEMLKKWDSVLKNMEISEEKKEWMSQYAEMHKSNKIVSAPDTIITSQPDYNILPIAMKIAAQTIGHDLVSVKPMSSNSEDEMNKIEQEVKAENRERKIDALVEGKEFNEMKVEEHPDFNSGPTGKLFYMDFVYGSTNSTTI